MPTEENWSNPPLHNLLQMSLHVTDNDPRDTPTDITIDNKYNTQCIRVPLYMMEQKRMKLDQITKENETKTKTKISLGNK